VSRTDLVGLAGMQEGPGQRHVSTIGKERP
jgi:hypothetical protein